MIVRWRWDAREVPEIALPLVEVVVGAAGIEEEDAGGALDEPAAVETLDAAGAHGLEGEGDGGVVLGRVLGLDLHGGGLVGEGPDEAVAVAVFGDGDGDFGLDDGVDAADWMMMSECIWWYGKE